MTMRRREFITLLGGAAAARPLAARAQKTQEVRRIGILMTNEESDPLGQARVAAFRDGLQKLGWTEGRNIRIDYRWATALERLRVYAAELVALAPDAIFCGASAVRPLQQATRTVPIVFVSVPDPVSEGFVASLARPGGNMTGFALSDQSIHGKRLRFLKEIAPQVMRLAFIYDPVNPNWSEALQVVQAAAVPLGMQVSATAVRSATDIERTIDEFARESNGGLYAFGSPTNNLYNKLIVTLALQHGLPGVYPFRYYVVSGGLISYNVDQAPSYPGAASYVDRILKGEKPGDLPVQQGTKFELAINAKTAQALGLTVPATLLVAADEVIE
jgi:putative ABC transport system substrate-binding protein